MRARFFAAAFAVGLTVLAGAARADDYVTIRGAYYREPSTRVIQPTMEVERDDDSGLDVKAHFLVDTITSASVSAGTSADSVFTETRNEAGLSLTKRFDRASVGLGYKYSAESDYWSHAIAASASARLWGDTATVGVSLGLSFDSLSSRFRTPACAKPPSTSCPLDSQFLGFSYTQILSPDALLQVSLEGSYLDGFEGNLYRSVPNFGYEVVPDRRLRTAAAARFAYYFAETDTTLRLGGRYYTDFGPGDRGSTDPWRIQSLTGEARLYQPVTRTLEVRLSYRQYWQTRAAFYCDTSMLGIQTEARCPDGGYAPDALYYSTDPKLGRVVTKYPEVKLYWLADAFEDVPILGWLSAGTFDISYGRYIQSTSFGDAHVLQLGYTMPY
ncbi:MAG TPA: DUF3570 domain-containing protein [Polyangia bacterium]|nr:DUF3570 domain-containing protein [Polyangia bacterium]